MEHEDLTSASALLKTTSEAVKTFYEIIEDILQPRGINLAILKGHIHNIENYVERPDIDEYAKLVFLSNYKKLIKEYKNSTDVINHSIKHISNNAKPEMVEPDWFSFFFDKVRLISDENVQKLWGQILAGEVNTPGKYPPSLLHTLSIISKSQATMFCMLCRFCMREYYADENIHPLLFISSNFAAYEKSRITSSGLLDLANLGLVQCDFKDEYIFKKKKIFRYGNNVIEVYGDPNNNDRILAGNVIMTQNGALLYELVDDIYKSYRSDIRDFTIEKFLRRNCKVFVNNRQIK